LVTTGYEQHIGSQTRISPYGSGFYSHPAALLVIMSATGHSLATAAAQVPICASTKAEHLGGGGAMTQPGRGFKHHIDSIVDPELLESERRSLQRLLVAARDPKQFRDAAAKTAYILDRLKTLADEESDIEEVD
jgi:hypothetical protein